MALDARLLSILACPEDRGPLLYFAEAGCLYNPRLRRQYRVDDDIPVLLIGEARTLTSAEHDEWLARATALGLSLNFTSR
jgi:uncharacterized protein YbaR (Trm112 family)